MSMSLNSHKNLTISNEVNQLCSEIFKSTPISLFAHARFHRNRELKVVMSNADMHEWYLNNNYHQKELGPHDFDDLPKGTLFANLLTSPKEKLDFRLEIKERFGYDNFLGLFVKTDDYCDIFNFAADAKQGNLANFYLNNINMIRQYIDTLHDPLKKILNSDSTQTLVIPETMDGFEYNATGSEGNECASTVMRSMGNLANQPAPRTQKVDAMLAKLTQRELDILKLIVHGYTAKEVGRQLGISYRTVENYCEGIKKKLRCRRKQDIILNYAGVFQGA